MIKKPRLDFLVDTTKPTDADSQTMHIECLKEALKVREKMVVRLLGTCTKLLGEWIELLPKRVRYRHHTELIDEAEEVIKKTRAELNHEF